MRKISAWLASHS